MVDLITRLQVCARFDPDQAEAIEVIQAQAARIAELEAVQQHIYHIVSTGILHQSSLSKDGLIELLKDAQEVSYNAGWNSTTLTGGENE